MISVNLEIAEVDSQGQFIFFTMGVEEVNDLDLMDSEISDPGGSGASEQHTEFSPKVIAKLVPKARPMKKVHFKDDLVEVIEFLDDSESKNYRLRYWENFASDRGRFKDRIEQTEMVLAVVLFPQHRNKVYNQRFQD